MPIVLKKFFASRKFWAFLVGLVTLISTALEDGTFSAQETQAISALVIGYIVSVAWEDGKQAEAVAKMAQVVQPTPTVDIDAQTVQVTPPAPPQPIVGRTGLQ